MTAAQTLTPEARAMIRLMTARLAMRCPRPCRSRIHMADIIDQVAYETGLHKPDLIGGDRASRLYRGRAAICWLARDLTSLSFPSIGALLGGRHHTSVIHACRRAADMRDFDPAFRRLTDRLRRHFRDLQED